MSVARGVWLNCDISQDCEPSGDGSIGQSDNVADARRVAREDGWHRTRDGRDICPDCWQDGAR